jgi:L-lactate dehydrogenase (cytochrome)
VAKIVRILEREIVTGMRLLGASNVRELTPEMVSLHIFILARVDE